MNTLPHGKTRKTDYRDGELLEITETTFHDYPIGTIVRVINSDWHQYHVVNVNADGSRASDCRFWWVKENQIKIKQP
jgi:hypothetical protein